MPDAAPLQVVPVSGRRALDEFIRMPWNIYDGASAWVPPLITERRDHLSRRNPFFEHAQACYWLAYRNQRPVGRISAQIDRLHLERYDDDTGFFGMIEAEDDPEVFAALLQAAEAWLRDQGMRRVRGPFNMSINDECGLLVEGFDTAPAFMMAHGQPYYPGHIEARGYAKAKDLLAYHTSVDHKVSPAIQAANSRGAGRVTIRTLRRKALTTELRILQTIFEDAWAHNWGFIPFTNAEFDKLGQALKHLVDDDMVQIAEVDGEPAAMLIAFPNINEVIGDLNGRLMPLGWLKLLWRIKVRYPSTARIALMGVRRRYQNSPVGSTLTFMMVHAIRGALKRHGVQSCELSWVLEDNRRLHHMLKALGAVPYKRYRIYEKALD